MYGIFVDNIGDYVNGDTVTGCMIYPKYDRKNNVVGTQVSSFKANRKRILILAKKNFLRHVGDIESDLLYEVKHVADTYLKNVV